MVKFRLLGSSEVCFREFGRTFRKRKSRTIVGGTNYVQSEKVFRSIYSIFSHERLFRNRNICLLDKLIPNSKCAPFQKLNEKQI